MVWESWEIVFLQVHDVFPPKKAMNETVESLVSFCPSDRRDSSIVNNNSNIHLAALDKRSVSGPAHKSQQQHAGALPTRFVAESASHRQLFVLFGADCPWKVAAQGPVRVCTAVPSSPWKNEETSTMDETGKNEPGEDSLAAATADCHDKTLRGDPPFFANWPETFANLSLAVAQRVWKGLQQEQELERDTTTAKASLPTSRKDQLSDRLIRFIPEPQNSFSGGGHRLASSGVGGDLAACGEGAMVDFELGEQRGNR